MEIDPGGKNLPCDIFNHAVCQPCRQRSGLITMGTPESSAGAAFSHTPMPEN
jgi:hypothetical protein